MQVSRNQSLESQQVKSFHKLQDDIFTTFASATPVRPSLRLRNATQTSVVLEWDTIDVGTADLRSLVLYRNGAKAGAIPRAFETTSTKISGLGVDTQYDFQLVLRTSAGLWPSEKLSVRTHKMTDLTGIRVTPGIMPTQLRDGLETSIERMGAKIIENVRIDTTHFVCTEGRGKEWEKAVQMNVPVVVPDWVVGCEQQGRIVGVRGYYLGADPKLRQIGTPGQSLNRTDSQSNTPAATPSQAQMRSNDAQLHRGSQQEIPERPAPGNSEDEATSTEAVPPRSPGTRAESVEEDSDEDEEDEKEVPRRKLSNPDINSHDQIQRHSYDEEDEDKDEQRSSVTSDAGSRNGDRKHDDNDERDDDNEDEDASTNYEDVKL